MEGAESYTYGVSQREENLLQRHWKVMTVGPPSERVKPAEEVAGHAMKEVNAKRKLLSLYKVGGGGEEGVEFWKVCLTRSIAAEFGAEFLQQVEQVWQKEYKNGSEGIAEIIAAKCEEEKQPKDTVVDGHNISLSSTQGSRTARMTADARRTAAALGFGPDYLAKHFVFNTKEMDEVLAEKYEDFKRFGVVPGTGPSLVEQVKQQPCLPMCLITYLQNRTCFLDDTITTFCEQFAEVDHNIVILGAGFDTRFYRMSLAEKAHKFEVDAPGTQEAKLRELRASGVKLPSDVEYVSCDFSTQSWLKALVDVGCKVKFPTLIIWEGVTQYLKEETVQATLKTVAEELEGPAAIAFDYYSPVLVKMFAANMKRSGEALQFGAEPKDMVKLVQNQGLRVLDHLRNSQCSEERYMPINNSTGAAVGIAGPHEFFLTACNKSFAEP